MLSAMARWIRRCLLLLLIGAGSAALFRMVRTQRGTSATIPTIPTSPEWPPFEPAAAPAPQPGAEPAPGPARETAAAWVEPVDGSCPEGYPIKAKTKSRIYHVPDGQFYGRTSPERCYATAEAAEQDGYRRAKA